MIAFYENRKNDFDIAVAPSLSRHYLQCTAHLHRHIELVLFLEGSTVAYADTERYVLTPGDAFISFPNQVHRFESSGPEKYYILIVNPDLVPELSHTFLNSTPLSARLPGAAQDPQLQQIAENLLLCGKEAKGYTDLIRRGYLQVLFAKLLGQMQLTDAFKRDPHALEAIISYCTKHYKEELTLSILEQELHISKYYISHLFSDKLNIRFNDYINSLRISYACHHLRHSDLPVTEIAEMVGFGTSRTFNRAFLKQQGCTPSEYRQGKHQNAIAEK